MVKYIVTLALETSIEVEADNRNDAECKAFWENEDFDDIVAEKIRNGEYSIRFDVAAKDE